MMQPFSYFLQKYVVCLWRHSLFLLFDDPVEKRSPLKHYKYYLHDRIKGFKYISWRFSCWKVNEGKRFQKLSLLSIIIFLFVLIVVCVHSPNKSGYEGAFTSFYTHRLGTYERTTVICGISSHISHRNRQHCRRLSVSVIGEAGRRTHFPHRIIPATTLVIILSSLLPPPTAITHR